MGQDDESKRSSRRPRLVCLTGALALIAVSCTGAGSGVEPEPLDEGTTTLAVPATPDAIATPAHSPFTSTAHQVPPPASPLGPLPSLNESPGCGGPQGIRGPYVLEEGDRQPDTQILGGPWGDVFGRDLAEVREHLVEVEFPNGDGDPVILQVHEQVAPALQRVIENLEAEQARGNVYTIEGVSTHRPSTVDPWRYLSFHAVGAAIDINYLTNPYSADNELITDMPDWFVAAWTEAGWCWGGDWQTIKDPMHYSWMGPRFSGDRVQAPMPPRTDPASFDRSLTFETGVGVGNADSIGLLADLDRDGAADAVRITRWSADGPMSIDVARALYHFDACWTLGPTPYPAPPGSVLFLEDRTGDGRPDLWVLDADGDGIALVVYTFASGYTKHLPPVEATVQSARNSVFLVADYDRDGSADLYVIESGDPAVLTVWRGPDFDSTLLSASLPLRAGSGWRFALGDREADGIQDLFALAPGLPADLVIVPLPVGSVGVAEMIKTGVAGHSARMQAIDFDGDGRTDLAFLDRGGVATVYLGGDRTGEADDLLMSWFLVGADRPWEYRGGCALAPAGPQ